MERSEFRQRMDQFKQARESNPQLSYWEWKNSLPDNLAHTPDWQYNNFGAYTGGLKPELNEDGYYHLGSRNPYTGEILKPKSHPTYDKAIQNDAAAGYFPYEKNGITYTKTYSPTGDISGYANGTDGIQSNTSEIPVTYSNGKWNYGYNPGAAMYFDNKEDNSYANGTDGIRNKVNEYKEKEFEDAPLNLKISSKLMSFARQNQIKLKDLNEGLYDARDSRKNVAQNTYLLSREDQEEEFLKQGYIKDNSSDYGLVRKAVGDRDIPIFQKNKDDITREQITPIGNIYNTWFGEEGDELYHAGNYPTAIYADNKTGKLYQKAFDLNDYGIDSSGTKGAKYPGIMQFAANILDKIGSPTVVTTGIKEIKRLKDSNKIYNTNDNIKLINLNHKFEPIIDLKDFLGDINGFIAGYVTPDIIVTPKNKK